MIDHAYSNTPENIIGVSVLVLAVSDHYPVCITRKLSKMFNTGPVHKIIDYRDTKTFNEEQLLNYLNNQPFLMISMMLLITFSMFSILFYQLIPHRNKK